MLLNAMLRLSREAREKVKRGVGGQKEGPEPHY